MQTTTKGAAPKKPRPYKGYNWRLDLTSGLSGDAEFWRAHDMDKAVSALHGQQTRDGRPARYIPEAR